MKCTGHKHSSEHSHWLLYGLLFCSAVENKAVGIMKPGHTFTIEPMINEG